MGGLSAPQEWGQPQLWLWLCRLVLFSGKAWGLVLAEAHSTGIWARLLQNTLRALARAIPPPDWARVPRWGVLGSVWHQDGACATTLLPPPRRALPRLLFPHLQPAHAVIIIIIIIIKLQGVA